MTRAQSSGLSGATPTDVALTRACVNGRTANTNRRPVLPVTVTAARTAPGPAVRTQTASLVLRSTVAVVSDSRLKERTWAPPRRTVVTVTRAARGHQGQGARPVAGVRHGRIDGAGQARERCGRHRPPEIPSLLGRGERRRGNRFVGSDLHRNYSGRHIGDLHIPRGPRRHAHHGARPGQGGRAVRGEQPDLNDGLALTGSCSVAGAASGATLSIPRGVMPSIQ